MQAIRIPRASRTLVVAAVVAALPTLARAETIYALHDGNELVRFDSATPATTTATSVTGLVSGETLVDIDFRPADGKLYGLTDQGRLYSIATATGAATLVYTSSVALVGTSFGMDFIPTNDRLRVLSDADQDFRIDMATGVATADPSLAYGAADAHFGENPNVTGLAFTNSVAGAATASQFLIDTGTDTIGAVVPATGQLNSIWSLGFNATGAAGLDVSRRGNTMYAALTAAASTGLYTIDRLDGTATLLGTIGTGANVRGIAVEPPPPPAALNVFGVTEANGLVRFSSADPATVTTIGPVTGLQEGEIIVGIDFRPVDFALYGVTNASRLYTIDTATAAATLVAPLSTGLAGDSFGIDFDPAVDRLRIVSNVMENVRVDPANANVTVDSNLAYAAADPFHFQDPSIVALGYTNDFEGAATTTLHAIDELQDTLVTIDPPDNGTVTTVGPLGVFAGPNSALDIYGPANLAFAALTSEGVWTAFCSVDLATGQATLIGPVGHYTNLRAMAIVPTRVLDVDHAVLKFNFNKPGKDKFMVSGTLPALEGPTGDVAVAVDIGGATQTFTLDSKGRSRAGDDTFALIGKPKNGRVKYLCQLKKGDFSDEMADKGMDGTEDAKKQPRTIDVSVLVGGKLYENTLTVNYTAKAGKSGIAKFAPDSD